MDKKSSKSEPNISREYQKTITKTFCCVNSVGLKMVPTTFREYVNGVKITIEPKLSGSYLTKVISKRNKNNF